MRILFYTHRFGQDLVAGAERHLWNLARQMARMGAEVDVATTREQEISAFLRFGLKWSDPRGQAREEIPVEGAGRPIRVHRFPVRNLPKPLAALCQKHLQRRWEREEMAMEPEAPFAVAFKKNTPLLLTGWHLPEKEGRKVLRWTMRRAAFQLPPLDNACLHIEGVAPKTQTIVLHHAGRQQTLFEGKGPFKVSADLDDRLGDTVAAIETWPVFRPLRDTRELGARISHLSLVNRGRIELAPMHIDHRTLRAQDKPSFIADYAARAEARPARFGWLFDQLRGPRCPGMEKFLESNAGNYDWVLAGVFPFATIPQAVQIRRRKPFRLALLPLFHVDDDFYYWRHNLDAMREADCSLANSWFSQETFFPAIDAPAIRAGAGVDSEVFRAPGIDGARFRKRYNFSPDERIVLTVGSKTGTKLYSMLIQAVENIQRRAPCRLVMVGPDEDRLPVNSPNCVYLGAVSQEDLLDAYDACDVFALMSESESFGMVFVEAWMRAKPVVGNRNCAPVAWLIDHGEDGLLASNRDELQEHLIALLRDPKRRQALGQAGLDKALKRHTWPVIARGILDRFESVVSGKSVVSGE